MFPNTYPEPFDEAFRQRVLDDLNILDTEPAPEFDRLTWLAATHFGTESSVVSLIDKDRQWFKSCHGLDATETPRSLAFCTHTIMENEPLVVLNTARDSRFDENPLVLGPPYIAFYAGAPLIINGANIGTLCVFDDKPRSSFDDHEKACLVAFAEIVVDELKLRDHARNVTESLVDEIATARETAAASETAKTQFLALMNHELRTPLNAVIGFAECITSELMGPVENSKYKEFAEQILFCGKSQLKLVERILKLTESGTVDLQEEILDLSTLVTRNIELLGGEVGLAGVTLKLRDLPKNGLWIKADRVHLEQIVLELVGNAIKFTSDVDKIWVELTTDKDSSSILTVTDTGPGIQDDALEKAMAAFSQLEGVYDRTCDGAGLGLAIVQRLASLHGAEFTLKSGKEGGTRAMVRFPAYRAASKHMAA